MQEQEKHKKSLNIYFDILKNILHSSLFHFLFLIHVHHNAST